MIFVILDLTYPILDRILRNSLQDQWALLLIQQIRAKFLVLYDVLNILFYNKNICVSWRVNIFSFVSVPTTGKLYQPISDPCSSKVSILVNGALLYPHL